MDSDLVLGTAAGRFPAPRSRCAAIQHGREESQVIPLKSKKVTKTHGADGRSVSETLTLFVGQVDGSENE